jgi:hypothetical protein
VACPADSTTLATGSVAESDCLCNLGFTGSAAEPPLVCSACAVGTFKDTIGPELCTACPEGASTEEPAATAFSDCLCAAGSTGTIVVPTDTCTACEEDTFKADLGPAECTVCPVSSTTRGATGGATFGSCLCDGGFGGTIVDPDSVCTQCSIGTWSAGAGAECAACPQFASTMEEGSSLVTDCMCIAGFQGANGGECSLCPFNSWKAELGPECTQCPTENVSQSSCTRDP